MTDTALHLTATMAGLVNVHVTWSRLLQLRRAPDGLVAGCVRATPQGEVQVRVPAAGTYVLDAAVSTLLHPCDDEDDEGRRP